ncbi:50S ribosomal protein L19 [Candidatus Parcubacteria bacterium]|nr:50S ribosomal protein L19 [Candidatus Parcubacteria bacterium]
MIKQQMTKEYLKNLPDIKVGDTIKVHQKIKEGSKQRIQIFEGLVLAKKHGAGVEGMLTVRKIISGVGVEKIFPLHSPNVEKFEIVSRGKVRRAKLYYLRDRIGKRAKIKKKLYIPGEETVEETAEPQITETDKILPSEKS